MNRREKMQNETQKKTTTNEFTNYIKIYNLPLVSSEKDDDPFIWKKNSAFKLDVGGVHKMNECALEYQESLTKGSTIIWNNLIKYDVVMSSSMARARVTVSSAFSPEALS